MSEKPKPTDPATPAPKAPAKPKQGTGPQGGRPKFERPASPNAKGSVARPRSTRPGGKGRS